MRRCHDCNSRYVKLGGSVLRTSDLQRLARRFAFAMAMVAAAAVVMLTILWFSRSQSNPSSDTGCIREPVSFRGTNC
jgi:multidrug resistance efflux pump